MNKKSLGSYYTPIRLSNFIADYCLESFEQDSVSILEPSVGDGNFVDAISNNERINRFQNISFTIVEREVEELDKAISRCNPLINLNPFNSDYLEFHTENEDLFSLIIGNPPYIKSSLLTESQRDICKSIHVQSGLKDKKNNNIWTAFLISAIQKLEDNGIIAFVLPLELLQVKFSEEIRDLLKVSFQRLEVFMFDELQFQECKGQDTVLIVGHKLHNIPGVFYTSIKSIEDLENRNFTLMQNASVSESNKKWTHHFITSDEHLFLEDVKSEFKLVSDYVNNKAGIVTAANDYFIIDKETLDRYNLEEFAKPIVQKGVFVNGSVTFSRYDYSKLINNNKPAFLLDFNDLDTSDIPSNIKDYILLGEKEKLQNRFKCKQRKNWYQVPNISKQSDAFFFKRAHEYPKLLKNEANVFVTDSAYKVEMKDNYNLNDFIFSFYNSLTLAFAELEGRYYGGGVLELTPNEFRVLPIPMSSHKDFNFYKKDFKNKKNIEDILIKYNHQILNNTLNLSTEEIGRIELIRRKLVKNRHRK